MNDQLTTAILKLNSVEEKDLVRQILEVFLIIYTLDDRKIIAAYQALEFFIGKIDDRNPLKKDARKILDAIVTRMTVLVIVSPLKRRYELAHEFGYIIRKTHPNHFDEPLRKLRQQEEFCV